jgi:hypothetical protein
MEICPEENKKCRRISVKFRRISAKFHRIKVPQDLKSCGTLRFKSCGTLLTETVFRWHELNEQPQTIEMVIELFGDLS